MFKSKKPGQKIDPNTGEVLNPENKTLPSPFRKPDFSKSQPLATYAGKLPKWYNLKDHPELNGVQIGIVGVVYEPEGEFGGYVKIAAYKLGTTPEAMIIYTGSSNVVERVLAISQVASPENPVTATLKIVGKGTGGKSPAWALE